MDPRITNLFLVFVALFQFRKSGEIGKNLHRAPARLNPNRNRSAEYKYVLGKASLQLIQCLTTNRDEARFLTNLNCCLILLDHHPCNLNLIK